MTAAEETYVDFPTRLHFVDEVSSKLLPVLQGMATYGGFYFDQSRGIVAVVQLTTDDAVLRGQIADLLPEGGSLEFRTVRSTYAQLERALAALSSEHEKLLPGVRVEEMSIETIDNLISIVTDPDDLDLARAAVGKVGPPLGVEIQAIAGGPVRLTACTSRLTCFNPMDTGVFLGRGGTLAQQLECTMGFHVRYTSTDNQWLTAGHCGFVGPNDWYMTGFTGNGFIGYERIIAQYCDESKPTHIDAMTVDFSAANEAQASDNIYADGQDITGYRAPNVGETLWASMGKSNLVQSGTVQNIGRTWTDPYCGFTMQGASMSGLAGMMNGDSGSPIYTRVPGGTGDKAIAIGILDGAGGTGDRIFAKVSDAVSRMLLLGVKT
jgi:hypothetical protein